MIKKAHGFTLIESLIVMVILASSMTAALYLLSTVVFSTQQNVKRTKAIYLAQECTELARNLRDTAWANFRPWNCAFGTPGDSYILSPAYIGPNNIPHCSNMQANIRMDNVGSDNDILWQENDVLSHYPTQPDAEHSGYRRTLTHDASTTDEISLTCRVEWDFNGRNQSLEAPLTLTNWRKQ